MKAVIRGFKSYFYQECEGSDRCGRVARSGAIQTAKKADFRSVYRPVINCVAAAGIAGGIR